MVRPTILAVAGSTRSKFDAAKMKDIVEKINDDLMLSSIIEKQGRDKALSNSDICLLAAIYGAKMSGCNIDIINLRRIIGKGGIKDPKTLEALASKAKGIIIASPVYFGDRSLLVDSFISFLRKRDLLRDKVIGCVSVGAKRNGGQETTNIYILKDVNDSGAYVVGNGPPTSQYGGTGWAGDLGTIREDNFGTTTSTGTGRKVAQIVNLLKMANVEANVEPLRLSFWIVQEFNGRVVDEVNKIMEYARLSINFDVAWDVLDFTKMNISPCQACNICPWHQEKKEYCKCKIQKDDFSANFQRMIKADAVVVCGYQSSDVCDVNDVYQRVLERTRSIRRDDFLLTNIPITSLSLEELPNNSLFSLKVMTSFLRHNTVIYRPLHTYLYNDKRLFGPERDLVKFLEFSMHIKKGGNFTPSEQTPKYLPIGYSAK